MARISILIALIGGIILMFSYLGLVVELIALVLAIVALIKRPKKTAWIFAILLSVLYILFPIWFYLKFNKFEAFSVQWAPMPSSAQYYIGPNYQLKQQNFAFDSLMMNPEQLQHLQLMSNDTSVGPSDAPAD